MVGTIEEAVRRRAYGGGSGVEMPTVQFELVTPEQLLVSRNVDMVVVPAPRAISASCPDIRR